MTEQRMPGDRSPEASREAERIRERREVLGGLLAAGMTGFALVSLGERAHASPLVTPACGTYSNGALVQDTDCGTVGPSGEVRQDQDCGLLLGGGSERSADHDCGIMNPDGSYTMNDRDCGTIHRIGGGETWYHQDNDCHLGPPDLDCGLTNGGGGSTWVDNGV